MSLIFLVIIFIVFLFLNLYLITSTIEVIIPEEYKFKKWWRRYIVSKEQTNTKKGENIY